MENSNERDPFKEAFRNKLADQPVSSPKDSELWRRVKAEIEHAEVKAYKINHFWIAAAATVLLCLSVSLALFVSDEPVSQVLSDNTKSLFKDKSTQEPASKSDNQVTVPQDTKIENPDKGIQTEKETPSASQNLASNSHSVSTGNSIKEHSLPDGSLISMNESTSVKIQNSFKEQRTVLLEEGEAYFEVQSDKAHPFTVFFDEYRLVVVGTKFNVRNRGAEKIKEVTVVEGIVRVFTGSSTEGVEVKIGEQLTLSKGEKANLSKVEAPHFISWKTKELDFNKTKLEQVATVLSRHFESEIILSPQLKNCTFTGDLSGLPLEEALNVIKISTSVKIERSNKTLYITGNSCD